MKINPENHQNVDDEVTISSQKGNNRRNGAVLEARICKRVDHLPLYLEIRERESDAKKDEAAVLTGVESK